MSSDVDLPARRYIGPDDIRDKLMIIKELSTVHHSLWPMICDKYSAGYQKVYDEHPIYVEKEGEARRRANIWLRKYIKKLNGTHNGPK